MPILIPITLIGWIPVCLVLFTMFPRRQAVLVGAIAAWLFLPPSGIMISGLPNYTKSSAFGYGILLATLVFVPDRLARFRPNWLDVPIASFLASLFATSVYNGLGVYDGVSVVALNLTMWGFPYLIGRVHFDDAKDFRAMTTAMVVGGLVYVPICLFEMAIGPVLGSKLYGLTFIDEVRLGAYRPRGFLSRGLELGLWMAVCSLLGLWLGRCRAISRIAGLPYNTMWLPLLVVTTVLCRASGAMVALAVGLAVLWASVRFRTRIVMMAWLSLSLAYPAARISDVWGYENLITFLQENFDAKRAQSLEFRFQNEDLLMEKAMLRPVLGWGGWGRARVYDAAGVDRSITDGYWVIVLGNSGIVGLLFYSLSFTGAGFAFVARYPPRRWTEPDVGAMAAGASLLGMYMLDNIMNAFPNAVFMVMVGALTSAATHRSGIGSASPGDEAGLATAPDAADLDWGADPPEARLAGRYVELARGSRRAGDHAAAAEAWRHAYDLLAALAERVPESPAARRRRLDCGNDLAWLLSTRPDPEPGDLDEAVELARAAAEAEPAEPAYWNTFALALCRLGDDESALAAARRSMELDAAWNGYDMAVLALALARAGRADEAGPWLAEAAAWRVERRPDDPALLALIVAAGESLAS